MNLGSFTLIAPLAEGGMGVVWKARHNTTGEFAAVKVLKGEQAQSDEFKSLLRQEVQATARFDHPNIVGIYDYGVIPETDALLALRAGDPYYVMEFIDGEAIGSVAKDWDSIVDLLLGILSGLAHAHARHVIHRDIKPDNVICSPQKGGHYRVVLADFGIAHAVDRSSPTWADGPNSEIIELIAGTPAYMAPEQAKGLFRDYGPWTDLYAVGVMAYEMVCGRLPFEAKSALLMLTLQVAEPFPALVPKMDVPIGFAAWVRLMTHKDPWKRFQSAAQAMRALRELHAPTSLDEETHSEMEMAETGHYTPFSADFGFDEPTSDVTSTDVPNSWSEAKQRFLPSVWVPSGVGLLGLRTIPFVGRRRERDLLWSSFEECVQTQSSRAVILSGVAGTGKSRLAQWLLETVRELGLATTYTATHQLVPSALDGLSGMLAIHYRCAGLSTEDIEERVAGILKAQDVDNDLETLALTAVMKGAGRIDEEVRRSDLNLTPAQQVQVILRTIARATQRLPAVVWLDDIQWGRDALALIEAGIDQQAPILFVVTAREESIDDLGMGNRLAEMAEHSRMASSKLTFFDKAATLRFVRQALTLKGELARVVAERCGGSPLFATQLVCHWVETEQLKRDGAELVLAVETPTIPNDITSLWHERLESLIESMSKPRMLAHGFIAVPAAPETVRQRLELAATLGLDISEDDWTGLCTAQKIPEVPMLLEAMVEAKLLVRRDGVFTFVHSLLRDTIADGARASNRWAKQNMSAATYLMSVYRSDHPDLARRAAALFGQAGSHELAVAALWSAFQRAVDYVDYAVIGELGEQLLAHLDAIPVPTTNEKYLLTQFWLGTKLIQHSAADDVTRGHELMRQGLAAARKLKDPDIHAVMLSASGWAQLHGGSLDEGLRIAREAVNLAVGSNAKSQVYRGLAFMLGAKKLHAEAAQYAAVALQDASRPIDDIRARATLGHQLLHLNAFDEGRNQLQIAVQKATEARIPARTSAVLNSLGDLELKSGQPEAALEAYQRSLNLKLTLLSDTASVHAVRSKVARALYHLGEHEKALQHFIEVREAALRGEQTFYAHPDDGVLACAAALQDWPLFDKVFDDAFKIQHPGWIHQSVIEALMKDLAAQGENDRLSRCAEKANELFGNLK